MTADDRIAFFAGDDEIPWVDQQPGDAVRISLPASDFYYHVVRGPAGPRDVVEITDLTGRVEDEDEASPVNTVWIPSAGDRWVLRSWTRPDGRRYIAFYPYELDAADGGDPGVHPIYRPAPAWSDE